MITQAQGAPAPSQTEHHLTDEDLERIANFGPELTDEQVDEIEAAACDKSRGQQRRLALVACSISADALSNLSISEPEAFKEMFECIEVFRDFTKGLAEMAESAYIRMVIADCRADAER